MSKEHLDEIMKDSEELINRSYTEHRRCTCKCRLLGIYSTPTNCGSMCLDGDELCWSCKLGLCR
jgi:hypothetical protein